MLALINTSLFVSFDLHEGVQYSPPVRLIKYNALNKDIRCVNTPFKYALVKL